MSLRWLAAFFPLLLVNCSRVSSQALISSTEYCQPALGAGRTWIFNGKVDRQIGDSVTLRVEIKSMDTRQLLGRTVVPFVLNGAELIFQGKDNTGCYSLAWQGTTDPEPRPRPGGPNYYFKYPIQVGTSWATPDEFTLLSKNVGGNRRRALDYAAE